MRLARWSHLFDFFVGIAWFQIRGAAMQRDLVRDGLRFKLAQRYQENPTHFLSLSQQAVDSAMARELIAELRNEGHVEEEVRGRIRLTPRGYRAFQNDPPPYSYTN
jgi:hypothetical protein